jgi:hypothetical protein
MKVISIQCVNLQQGTIKQTGSVSRDGTPFLRQKAWRQLGAA